jgi:hypothetical protein
MALGIGWWWRLRGRLSPTANHRVTFDAVVPNGRWSVEKRIPGIEHFDMKAVESVRPRHGTPQRAFSRMTKLR